MTQHEAIIRYMKDFGSITPMEAFSDLGITKLSTRIGELCRNGIAIDREYVSSTNRYGETTKYMKYRLVE